MQIKKGDKVQIIAGKDKGKQGVVLTALPKEDRVVVEGINKVKKHTKPSQNNQQGGIVEFEAPIHVSNVQVIDPVTKLPVRIGHKQVGVDKDGNPIKVRCTVGKKASGEVLDKVEKNKKK